MGRSQQSRPRKLAIKLRKIRQGLGLNKKEMTDILKQLASKEKIGSGHVYQYEEGTRLPSYLVLLAYAKSAGVSTDYLIDDKLELTEKDIKINLSDWITKKERI